MSFRIMKAISRYINQTVNVAFKVNIILEIPDQSYFMCIQTLSECAVAHAWPLY